MENPEYCFGCNNYVYRPTSKIFGPDKIVKLTPEVINEMIIKLDSGKDCYVLICDTPIMKLPLRRLIQHCGRIPYKGDRCHGCVLDGLCHALSTNISTIDCKVNEAMENNVSRNDIERMLSMSMEELIKYTKETGERCRGRFFTSNEDQPISITENCLWRKCIGCRACINHSGVDIYKDYWMYTESDLK